MKYTIYNTPIVYPCLRWLSKTGLSLFGWAPIGKAPELKKYMVIGAPHTSNWDFIIGLAIIFAAGWKLHWVGKHTLFAPPFGWLMRWLGGFPVDRRQSHNTVDGYIKLFEESEQLALVIAPEGTRKANAKWKTGFYHIANGAQVPIVLGYLNFEERRAGMGDLLQPSGDIAKDFQIIRQFYSDKVGKRPQCFSLPENFQEDSAS